MDLKTFRITFHLLECFRPRQSRIVRARTKEEAESAFLQDSTVPSNAIKTSLNIKQIDRQKVPA
jgi:hypothetical protein